MRKKLAADEGQRKTFRAFIERFGKKAGYLGYSEETILLSKVTDIATGEIVTDHLWFAFSKGFQDAGVKEGVTVEFAARVKGYSKGYVNRKAGINHKSKDFKLSHPTQIKLVVK